MKSLANLWSDYLESIDLPSALRGSVFAAWIILLFCTIIPYTPENFIKVDGFGLLPAFLFLGILLCSATAYFIILKRPHSFLKKINTLTYSLILSIGCSFLFLNLQNINNTIRIFLAVAFIGIGFSGILLCSEKEPVAAPRRRGVAVCSSMLAAAILCVLILLLPRWLGTVIFIFLPIVFGMLSILYSKKDRSENKNTTDGLLSKKERALTRKTLFLFGALYSLAFQMSAIGNSYYFGALEDYEGIIGLLLLVLIFLFYIFYILKNVKRSKVMLVFKPVGIMFMLSFFLRFIFGSLVSPLICALAFAGISCLIASIWILVGQRQLSRSSSVSSALAISCHLSFGLVVGQVFSLIFYHLFPEDVFAGAISINGLLFIGIYYWLYGKIDLTDEKKTAPFLTTTEQIQKQPPTGPDAETHSLAIKKLSKKGNLTPREEEVLSLYVKGRNLPYICDELVISRSTTQTHTKHIYSKLNVSNRQELLDLYEMAFGKQDSSNSEQE